ncbi:MAG TPA: lipopolysaccharide heptosyltransferase I, partial [Deltaproteobacteria bacterium]|nr:lipopolysaccharide heptosyltransferase I [Deltaproteobacteria bacterium]
MRILIIKTSAMGDIIHALPVLDYLHQAVPDAAVDWIVEEPFKDILEGNPLLHRLHIIRTRKW